MDIIVLTKNFLDVAGRILGLKESLRGMRKQERDELASLLGAIGDVLANVAAEVRQGGVPHGNCQQLIQFSEHIDRLTAGVLGATQASDLAATLRSSYDVEGLAMALSEAADKETHLAQIEQASGKFLALGKIVRAMP